MSQVRVNKSSLTNIANAIRDKNHETAKYKPSEMPTAISRIKTTDPVIEALTVTENGTYTSDKDGYNPVTVNVQPKLESLTVTNNGKYTAPAEIDGYSEVDVNVQPTLKSINITANGQYTPTDADGFNEVNVAVEGIPTDAELTITGNCRYRFAYEGWNWVIKKYGNRITTQNVSTIDKMFVSCYELESIPFSINCGNFSSDVNNTHAFAYCYKLKELPPVLNLKVNSIDYFCGDCQNIRSIPEDYFDTWDFSVVTNNSGWTQIFSGCWSLRKIPVKLFEHASLTTTGYYYSPLNELVETCYSLDELIDFPLPSRNATLTANIFTRSFNSAARLKNLKFKLDPETNAPYVVQWKSQVIDLTSQVGYIQPSIRSYIIGHNSGITADKEVNDDATYAALKNDPDWFATDINYSRYNHDSAVETINSLPDASAYLATAGGTNTIKFYGMSGNKTDGGAIRTLTEAEIAVATAKGWTVEL